MALIWRCVFEVDDAMIKLTGPEIVERWLQKKTERDDLRLPAPGARLEFESHDRFDRNAPVRNEVDVAVAEVGGVWAQRTSWTEYKQTETVTTSGTVLVDDRGAHVWIDLDRWGAQAFIDPWVPQAPGLVADYLRSTACSVGGHGLTVGPRPVDRQAGEELARFLFSPTRRVPVVVVSARGDDPPGVARDRADQIERRLRGVADVVVLRPGASTQLSRVLHETIGDGFDVYNGAIRTYLPGLDASSSRWAHRLISPASLTRRPPDRIGEMVAQTLQRAACALPLPPTWTPALRDELLGRAAAGALEEHAEAFEFAADELAKAERTLRDVREELLNERGARERAETQVEVVRTDAAETEEENEKLRGRVEWLEAQLSDAGSPVWQLEPQPQVRETPQTCGEVPARAAEEFSHIEFPESQWQYAEALDVHMSGAWAKKAWRVLKGFEAYSALKASGEFVGDFDQYCKEGRSGACPVSWIARSESESTDNSGKFSSLRTFPISPEAGLGDRIYMPSHIKLEQGGYPAPRIHFYDDTGGTTGKVHVGYFGEHKNNKSTN